MEPVQDKKAKDYRQVHRSQEKSGEGFTANQIIDFTENYKYSGGKYQGGQPPIWDGNPWQIHVSDNVDKVD